jgi:P pilus assembly chaperone PapD
MQSQPSPHVARLRVVIAALALGSLHSAGLATAVSEAVPVTLSLNDSGYTVANTSEFHVFATLRLLGTNFRTELPCEGTLYLPPGSVRTVPVTAKHTAKPVVYRVRITRLETKTLSELRSEKPSVATPMSAASARALEALRCQSQ